MTTMGPRVVYLDHSIQPGGAQLALARVLKVEAKKRVLLIPGNAMQGWGVYSGIDSNHQHDLIKVGREQGAGATTHGSLLSSARFAIQILSQAIALRRTLAFREATIVHANSARAGLYGAFACLASGKILVIHLRDMTDRSSLGKVGYFGFINFALRRANAVIANSKSTLASAEPHLNEKVVRKVLSSPIGITAPSSPPAVSGQVRTVAMVARIDTWKGQEIAIRAFALAFKDTHVRLLFAGDALFGKESIKAELEELCRSLDVATQVDFLGHVSDIQSFISEADICIHASTRPEPLGQNVLQYLRLGRPTVAVNEGGPAEWVIDGVNGLLVPMGDVDALAESLTRLAQDFHLRVSLSNAASITPGILSDEEVCEAQDQLYEQLACTKS